MVISHFYSPEIGAPINRMVSFVEAMQRKGHQVCIICGFPNYPGGILKKEDRRKLYRIEKNRDITIIRTYVFCSPKYDAISRAANQLSFALSSLIAGLLLPRNDIVVTSIPPLFHAFGAMIISKLKKSKFVLDFRDLWCDSAKALNAIKSSKMLRLLYWIESKLILHSDLIFVISRGMQELIIERGGGDKTRVIYNGADDDILCWKNEINTVRQMHGWENKFIICYAGILGLGQKAGLLIDLIPALAIENTIFLFIGEGPEKEKIKSKINSLNLKNAVVMDKKSRQEIISYIYAADIMLVLLDEIELFKVAIPSKFFDSMASGKPILTNVNGELKEILEKYDTGIYFSFKEKDAFFSSLHKLYNDKKLRDQMGANGKSLVSMKFRRVELGDKAINNIESLKTEMKAVQLSD